MLELMAEDRRHRQSGVMSSSHTDENDSTKNDGDKRTFGTTTSNNNSTTSPKRSSSTAKLDAVLKSILANRTTMAEASADTHSLITMPDNSGDERSLLPRSSSPSPLEDMEPYAVNFGQC